ncbi:GGDEF domain-containing protein [Aliarcobacter butzleri]|uniref:GGDEF domain-containing protein n=1 Tax=Aliarcobacter butzleri TaxID=28197 RepID=UPI00263C259D|nr:GGDEF domain-containing protein [Aliarcobacter butzleri]MDN5053452.1 GGDEF domain-containing protein [Aliarcobacter butzleri]
MSIYTCSEDEIENIILITKNLVDKHSFFYNNLLKKIICKLDIEEIEMEEYLNKKNCPFNDFIKSFPNITLEENFEKLINTHEYFHKLLNKTLMNYINNKTIKEKLFDDLYIRHKDFINELDNIIFKYNFRKNQLDKLTLAWNREIFLELLEKEYFLMKREEASFSLVYFDIDFFKNINDTYFHDFGDFILKELVRYIKTKLRRYDSICRWGGDEFLVLLPKTNLKEATDIINRIRIKINKKRFILDKNNINITCSFGIVESTLNETIQEIITRADELLYKAKKLGKNRIEI